MLKADTFWKEALAKAPRTIALTAPRTREASKEDEVSSRGDAQVFSAHACLAGQMRRFRWTAQRASERRHERTDQRHDRHA